MRLIDFYQLYRKRSDICGLLFMKQRKIQERSSTANPFVFQLICRANSSAGFRCKPPPNEKVTQVNVELGGIGRYNQRQVRQADHSKIKINLTFISRFQLIQYHNHKKTVYV